MIYVVYQSDFRKRLWINDFRRSMDPIRIVFNEVGMEGPMQSGNRILSKRGGLRRFPAAPPRQEHYLPDMSHFVIFHAA